ncbi:hypothetical protein CACET_c11350 [Clostridium aceticum]|uniref:DUF4181 domain-containing protein n=1 Tax=Clostridium aceticum TaxID=84022 RepID=A0A0G3W9S0_9CLOT|nr:hypothetical protein CACET_c11350 [Clostridium aceticum]
MLLLRVFILLLPLFLLFLFIEKLLRKRLGIEKRGGLIYTHVNKLHKIGERVLMVVFLLVLISLAGRPNFPIHPGGLVFVYFFVLFSFRTFMEWKYLKTSKEYILSSITVVMYITLFLILSHPSVSRFLLK